MLNYSEMCRSKTYLKDTIRRQQKENVSDNYQQLHKLQKDTIVLKLPRYSEINFYTLKTNKISLKWRKSI